MFEKRKRKLRQDLKQWIEQKQIIEQEEILKEDKRKFKQKYKKHKTKIATSKALIYFLFINCTVIELTTIYVTIKSLSFGNTNFTALQMLITAVVGEVIAFAIYSIKSTKENTKGGVVYQASLLELESKNNQQEESQG